MVDEMSDFPLAKKDLARSALTWPVLAALVPMREGRLCEGDAGCDVCGVAAPDVDVDDAPEDDGDTMPDAATDAADELTDTFGLSRGEGLSGLGWT